MRDQRRRYRYLAVVLVVVVIATLYALATPRPAYNYLDPATPVYTARYAAAPVTTPYTITVVTYNIQYAEKIETATADLSQLALQHGLDIALLQEMDAAGVDQIARSLKFNYVYYPATIHPRSHRDFGNAILTRWPILNSEKLLLPHLSPATNITRTATKAVIQVGGTNVTAYSTHTETILTLPAYRSDQYTAIAGDVGLSKYVVVGGDFNSLLPGDADELDRTFGEIGMQRTTGNIASTLESYNLSFVADHLFTRGFQVEQAGVLATAEASDHFPVWAQFTFTQP
ncbi:MAG: endonuclease/exonuclease/phosphatase family protein [Anaerolineales bacterium]|nr:endonuclease/exonuclease/phosphatase family protein [Anaerolineales bacterium]